VDHGPVGVQPGHMMRRSSIIALLAMAALGCAENEVSNAQGGGGGAAGSDAGTGPVDAGSEPLSEAETVQKPGPSPELFAAPFYRCLRSFHVAPDGDDAADGTEAHPWQTLQYADASGPVAGDCIIVAPGSYPAGVRISHGGNLASSTGYVVYRCAELGKCVVTAPNLAFGMDYSRQPMASYVVIDGFELAAASAVQYGQGIMVYSGNEAGPNAPNASHHVWAINNVIHGYGQGGIQMNDGEYLYAIHNTIYGNSMATCDAQGSGISYCVLKAFDGYTPTSDDQTNPSPLRSSRAAPRLATASWRVTFPRRRSTWVPVRARSPCAHEWVAWWPRTDGGGRKQPARGLRTPVHRRQ
jgi:hypothetical protein